MKGLFRCRWLCVLGIAYSALSHSEVIVYTDSKTFKNDILDTKIQTKSLVVASYGYIFKRLTTFPDLRYENQIRIEKFSLDVSPTCIVMKLRTPDREQRFLFSEATDVFLPHKLYVHNALAAMVKANFTDDKGEISSLADVIHHSPSHSLLLISGHRFGQHLDDAIAKVHKSQRYYLNKTDPYYAYFNMFNQHRELFALLFPSVVKRSKTPLLDYTSFAIANSPTYLTGHIMCNNHEESARFIQEVNAILYQYFASGMFEKHAKPHFPIEEQGVLRHFIYQQTQRLKSNSLAVHELR